MKEDEQVEKQFRKVESQLEADYADLRAEVKELEERQQQDKWTIHSLLTRLEMIEARMALVSSQVAVVALPQRVDLTREEDEGGVGGQIEFGSPFRQRSLSPQEFTREELDAVEVVGRNWEFLNVGDVSTEGVYTPTGPRCSLWESPEL